MGTISIEMIPWRGILIPKTVYKYRDWNNDYHRRLLLHQKIFIPSPSNFNDPFDCKPIFNEDKLKNENEIKKMHDLFGVYSVTPINNNVLMWAHYAKDHTGFCVGFDSFKLFNYLNSGGTVQYVKEYPKILSSEENETKKIKMFYTKAWYWNYEIEYRLLVPNFVNIEKQINKEIISEVILGYRMTQEKTEDILKIVKVQLPHVKVFKTRPKFNSFELEIIELK